jgi:hypothetical protein
VSQDELERAPGPAPVSRDFTIDLRDEGRYVVRRRLTTSIAGVSLGSVFGAIGAYELALLHSELPGPDPIIAALLLVLGASLVAITLRGSLLNPILRIQVNDEGLLLLRRWGPRATMRWDDPAFNLQVLDPGPDTSTSPEEKQHLFFFAAQGTYGSLGRSDVGPLLDAFRAHGLIVRMAVEAEGTGSARHRTRRIRIGPASG